MLKESFNFTWKGKMGTYSKIGDDQSIQDYFNPPELGVPGKSYDDPPGYLLLAPCFVFFFEGSNALVLN